MQGSGFRGQGSGHGAMASRLAVCAVVGCGRWRAAGMAHCVKCSEEIAALDARAAAVTPAKRLESFAYVCASIAAMCLLLWETQGFWMDWIGMWVGWGQ